MDYLDNSKGCLEDLPTADSLNEEMVLAQISIANGIIALVEELRLIWGMIIEEGLPMQDKP